MSLVAACWLLVSSVLAFAGGGRAVARRAVPVATAPVEWASGRPVATRDGRAARPTASARRGRGADETLRADHARVSPVAARLSHPSHVGAAPFAPAAAAGGAARPAADLSAPARAATAAYVVAARGALLPYYPTAPPFQS